MALSAQTQAPPRMCRVGDRVRVRRQRWRVTAIDEAPGCRTLTLDGLGPGNLREQRQLFEPFGDVAPIDAPRPALRWRAGQSRWQSEWCDVLAHCGGWDTLHAVNRARLTVLPHQLEPALAIVSGFASRLLLADAVGLGKTVQAGLALVELVGRRAAASTLILTPSGLRDQWQHELADRFDTRADIIDLRSTVQRAADLPVGVNPWLLPAVAISSIDYVKRPEVLPAVRARGWDLVIVDEAHLVSPGSDRYRAISLLCNLALYVVLLTATPHNGDRDAYHALLALGAHTGSLEDDDACLVFRRARTDVQLTGERHVHHLRVRPTSAELRMHASLDRYAAAVRAEQGDSTTSALLLTVFRKRALSSPRSLERSARRRLALLGDPSNGEHDDCQLRLPLDDGGGEFDQEDRAPDFDAPALRDIRRERTLLARIAHLAGLAAVHESKLAALRRLVRRLANRHEAVLIFTEYRDTLLHLQQSLLPDALLLHGGLTRRERTAVVDAFTSQPTAVLLATDAASEGLNLHQYCRCVIHLEVPWNPVRLEQRTGRLDRIGQRRTVHAFHLIAQHPAEVCLLDRLQRRADIARADIPERHSGAAARADGLAACAPRERRSGECGSAAIEAARIVRARLLLSRHEQRRRTRSAHLRRQALSSIGWRVRARGRLRLALGGRSLLLGEQVLQDDARRTLASTVAGWWMVTGAALPDIPPVLPSDTQAWFQRALDQRTRFWRRARTRAAAIAAAAEPLDAGLFQPGLFDRRADRLRQSTRDEQAALTAVLAARTDRIASNDGPANVVSRRWLHLGR